MADEDKSLYSLRYNQVSSNLEAFGGGSPQWTLVTLNNVDPQQVPITRQINTTAPLTGGGNLTADRTISIPQATSSADGFLTASDWTTFDTKLSPILASANIFVGNGSNVAVGVPLSGDAILSNTGTLTLQTVNGNVGSFTNANITVDAKGRITAAANGAAGITQLTGDITAGPGSGSQAATLATVNAGPGSFTNASLTVNAKGLVTAASSGVAPAIAYSSTTSNTALNSSVFSDIDLSATIQPTLNTSKVLVRGSVQVSVAPASGVKQGVSIRLLRGATPLAMWGNGVLAGGAAITSEQISGTISVEYLDSPGTTSSVVYKLQGATNFGAGNGTGSVNDSTGDTPLSSITAQEIPV